MPSQSKDTDQLIPRHDLESLTERSIPFESRRIEDFDDKAWANYPHRHAFYEIHMVRSGSGTHYLDDQEYEIEKNAIYLLSPEEVHYWDLKTSLKGFVMVFKEEFLLHASSGVSVLDDLSFFHQSDRGNFFRPDAKETRQLMRLFQKIIMESKQRQLGWENVVRALTHIFLIEIQRSINKDPLSVPVNRKLSLARKFRRLVDNHALSERQVEFYAEQLKVSGGHLHAIIKEVFDDSPGRMITESIVREAKRRLIYTTSSVSEIGYALNFEDPSYFSRLFRKHSGQSPSAFRESLNLSHRVI